jgi:glycosyltransferase involved in cell wall biosynthesis
MATRAARLAVDDQPAPGGDPVPGISVMIFTLNEEPNLPSCLDSLEWCDDVIVVDSFSTDATESIARAAGARFFARPFDGFGKSRNWALDHTAPKHEWVLILDADERVPRELAEEMVRVVEGAAPSTAAFRMRRRFHMWGRWLRHSSLYPSWVVRLVHRDRVRYENRGHSETQHVRGDVLELENDLIDENHKGIEEWLERQMRYARREADFELAQEANGGMSLGDLASTDPLARRAAVKRIGARIPGRAAAYFVYSYLLRGGFRDGVDGLVFCTMKALYQQAIVVRKYDARRRAHAAR